MIVLHIFVEFLLIGLFAVGGGLATIPFLQDLAQRTGWFTLSELTNMIAVSESTPGPIGVNMATYVGLTTAHLPGAIVATIGLIAPCVVLSLIIAAMLKKFRENPYVDAVFYGLRPASMGLMAAATVSVIDLALLHVQVAPFALHFQWGALLLAALIALCTHLPHLKKLHPILWIVLSAALGVLFQL